MRMAWPGWKKLVKPAIKTALGLIVLWAVGRHVLRTWSDLHKPGRSLHVEPLWMILAGLLYLAGLLICGYFFGQVLKNTQTPVSVRLAIRAYVISHLGKYVPGKAMVVVMRVGMVVPHGVRASTAAIATFFETLVMMAAGSIVAVIGFSLAPRPLQLTPIALSLGLTACFLTIVDPFMFPRASRLITRSLPTKIGPEAYPVVDRRLLVRGLAYSTLAWLLFGLSQVAVVRAVASAGVGLGLWPLVIASVALATVAGFVVAVLPGGLGIREGVIMTTLAPAIGQDTAVVAALALRLTWVITEATAAGILAVLPLTRPLPTTSGKLEP